MAVYVERNLAPIFVPNPNHAANPAAPEFWRDSDFNDALLAMGARPYFTVGDGTLNNARLWSNDDGTLMPAIPTTGGPFDWSRAGNYSNPPAVPQVQACSRLALQPAAAGCALPPGVTILFDIEACSTLNTSGIDPPEKWRAALDLAAATVQAARAVNPKSPLLWFGWPLLSNVTGPNTPSIVALDSHYMQDLAAVLSGVCVCVYDPMWYPGWLDNPAGWFDAVDGFTRDGDRYFGNLPRFAVASPVYWSFSGVPADHSRDGQPVPPELWQQQLHYLHERRFEILLFTGGLPLSRIGQDHLNALRPYLR